MGQPSQRLHSFVIQLYIKITKIFWAFGFVFWNRKNVLSVLTVGINMMRY